LRAPARRLRDDRQALPIAIAVEERGNNRQAIFFAAEDYARYRDWLADAAGRAGC
jgi:hypothetical protein